MRPGHVIDVTRPLPRAVLYRDSVYALAQQYFSTRPCSSRQNLAQGERAKRAEPWVRGLSISNEPALAGDRGTEPGAIATGSDDSILPARYRERFCTVLSPAKGSRPVASNMPPAFAGSLNLSIQDSAGRTNQINLLRKRSSAACDARQRINSRSPGSIKRLCPVCASSASAM